jgi:2-hydroxy-3-oxopropionate reductase
MGAKAGTLAIMVGGPREAFDRALPVFEAMGQTITYVGESGAGQVAKACNQLMVAAQMVAMGELLLLAQRAGVSPEKVVEAISGGAAQCWTLDIKAPRLFSGERGPGFRAHMMHKDLAIVLDTARSYGMPLPAAANHMHDLDNSAVIGVLETLVGEELEEAN